MEVVQYSQIISTSVEPATSTTQKLLVVQSMPILIVHWKSMTIFTSLTMERSCRHMHCMDMLMVVKSIWASNQSSPFYLAQVYWENNHATLGGAIYVRDDSPLSYCAPLAPYVPKEQCFFQLPGQNLTNGIDIRLVFKNNSADITGSTCAIIP